MIVCSCNVLSDHDVRKAFKVTDNSPGNTKQIYGCLGCSVECGRCARTIRTLVDEALVACGSTSWKHFGSPVLAPEVPRKLADSEVGPRVITQIEVAAADQITARPSRSMTAGPPSTRW
jgi:bacterioferritin-associated ferredoxin